MKIKLIAVLAVCLIAATVYSQQTLLQPKQGLTDLKSRMSYMVGRNIGRSLKSDEIDVDFQILVRGLKEALDGTPSAMSEEELQQTMAEFREVMMEKERSKAAGAAEKNVKEGAAFLAANKQKPGVVTLPSGLQYKVLKQGAGATPKATDTVTTHYRGTLLDGTEFDSSYSRNEPASFPVGGVIAGWTEALQLMKVGDKWQLFIPANLAYGQRGAGQDIGPNATLVFEIELLGIQNQ